MKTLVYNWTLHDFKTKANMFKRLAFKAKHRTLE